MYNTHFRISPNFVSLLSAPRFYIQMAAVQTIRNHLNRSPRQIMLGRSLFPNDFYQNTLASAPVELAVRYLLPRAEVQFAVCYYDDYLSPHHLPLHRCIGIIFPSTAVPILPDRFVRCELFQPNLVVVVQSALVIVNENGCRNMHRANKSKAFLDSAFFQAGFHLRR